MKFGVGLPFKPNIDFAHRHSGENTPLGFETDIRGEFAVQKTGTSRCWRYSRIRFNRGHLYRNNLLCSSFFVFLQQNSGIQLSLNMSKGRITLPTKIQLPEVKKVPDKRLFSIVLLLSTIALSIPASGQG